LNVNSIRQKINEINKILETKIFDFVVLQETNLNENIPASFYKHNAYRSIRRDRHSIHSSGGIIVFIRKEYTITNIQTYNEDLDFEFIRFDIKFRKKILHFITCYKPPSYNEKIFISQIENVLFTIDSNEPIFLLGDLNMDLINNNNENLIEFISHYELKNYVTKPTRTLLKYYQHTKQNRLSSTLIDVVIHNHNLIDFVDVLDCSFSDHDFVAAKLKFDKEALSDSFITKRDLNEKNIALISQEMLKINFEKFDLIDDVDERWATMKADILIVLDKIAPEKS